eukprot:442155-Hanusia_phi.AAC.1
MRFSLRPYSALLIVKFKGLRTAIVNGEKNGWQGEGSRGGRKEEGGGRRRVEEGGEDEREDRRSIDETG